MERNWLPQADAPGQAHTTEEWAQILARTIAHLAAQLTISQLRLRALATVLEERATIDESQVQARLRSIAAIETGDYLRENLGPALADVVETEALEAEIIAYLQP